MESQTPTKEAMDEWYDHPVTAYYLEILNVRVQDYIDAKVDVFYPGEPFRTQEDIACYRGIVEELSAQISCLASNDVQELDPEYVAEEEPGNE